MKGWKFTSAFPIRSHGVDKGQFYFFTVKTKVMAFETIDHVTAKIKNGNKVTGQIKEFDCFGCSVSYVSTTDVSATKSSIHVWNSLTQIYNK
jgi:hypothetical protein